MELFRAFFEGPSKESFLAVREGVLGSSDYHPFSATAMLSLPLMEAGEFQQVRDKLHQDMTNTLLSPLAHLLNRDAADKLEEKGQAALEHTIYQRCVEGILSAGEGTLDSPYPVLRMDDIGDVLRHKELLEEFEFLELISQDGRYLEKYEVGEEQEMLFDVTAPYQWLEKWLGGVPAGMAPGLVGFLLHPSVEDYLELREQMVASGSYNPYSRSLDLAGEALMAQDWERMEEAVRQDMPNLLLSPRAHQLLARAAQERGDSLETSLRMQFGKVLYEALQNSGDGSREQPWLCLREEDEADLLGGLGSPPARHKTLSGDRYLERIVLQDGRAVFMDLTVPFEFVNSLFQVD